jgi:hypothetical protein
VVGARVDGIEIDFEGEKSRRVSPGEFAAFDLEAWSRGSEANGYRIERRGEVVHLVHPDRARIGLDASGTLHTVSVRGTE